MHVTSPSLTERALVVADWTVDPAAVVEACAARHRPVVLTVPAWLHGLDWAGDPRSSCPCAQRQLEAIADLGRAAGLDIEIAGVGDPDPMSAIGDALAAHPAGEVLLFTRHRRVGAAHPWDLEHRARRLTGLPVRRIGVPARRRGHCQAEVAQAA
jgi:hypothetical protein